MPKRQRLTKENILAALRRLMERLRSFYSVKKIGLFGSFSRGDQTILSDIDLIVEFSRPIGIEFVSLANELERVLCAKVDLVSRKGIKKHYFKAIRAEIIYA